MPTAKTDAVRIGKAPRMTDTIVAAKMAKRCQPWGVNPWGTGQNQIPAPSATTASLATRVRVSGLMASAARPARLFVSFP